MRFFPEALLLLLTISILNACVSVDTADTFIPRDASFIVWAHSDIQPESPYEKIQYKTAVDDINQLPYTPDIAIIAGDIIYRKNSRHLWKWQKQLRKETSIPYWYEIAGNHDHNNIQSYFDNSGKPCHYAVQYGNILFILLSDEKKSAITNISDRGFAWWKKLVINNQDKIIITVTHAALEQSGLISTVNYTMNIQDSKRFWKVIQKYQVDLWLSAHTHLPNGIPIKKSRQPGCATLFLDISGIHKSRGSPIESWLLFFTDGSSILRCLARNHEKRKFYKTSFSMELSRPFHPGNRKPVIIDEFNLE